MKALSNIQIIMINTTLPANIGSAARAMHTMGFSNLTIIEPKLPIDESSYSHAAGGIHILENAKILKKLDEAVAGSQLIFAASSRSRSIPRPVVNPIQAAQIMSDFLATNNSINNTSDVTPNISVLFGREDRGLTNEELAIADYHIQIDANPDYPVLNVASAIQVISSFIYSHFTNQEQTDKENQLNHVIRQEWDARPVDYSQQEALNKKIVELMTSLQLADEQDLRLLPQRLSRLTSRLQLDEKEYQILQSIIGKLLQT